MPKVTVVRPNAFSGVLCAPLFVNATQATRSFFGAGDCD